MSGEAMKSDVTIRPEDAFLKELDARIVQALESRPETAIPSGFAARMASQVPARRPVRLPSVLSRPTHYGHWTLVASLVALIVVLAAMAFSGFGRTAAGQAIEGVFYAQLVTLALWFGFRRPTAR